MAGSFADAFVSKYNPAGSALVYSTFLGGSDIDQGTAIAVDGQGAAYVAGNTNSSNFPTVGPVQSAKGNEPDAFVLKIDPPGGALVYSTYLGGSGADGANGIAVDRTGSAHVVGTTGSSNLVTAKPVQAHAASVRWNDYRRRYVMICQELHGSPSLAGEIWYAEADAPEGPWRWARKIVSHRDYTFYNPCQHAFFDSDGGRLIYFEGTYTAEFSGARDRTPRYNYNQVLYRLDLSDPRLKLPEPRPNGPRKIKR